MKTKIKTIARYMLLLLRVITIIVCMAFAMIIAWEFISVQMIKFIFNIVIFLRIDTILTTATLALVLNFYMISINKPRIFSELLSAQVVIMFLFLNEWVAGRNPGGEFYLPILFCALVGAIVGGEIHENQKKQSSQETVFLFLFHIFNTKKPY